MKQIVFFIFALGIAAGAQAQDLPDQPQPAPAAQTPQTSAHGVDRYSMWDRMERLPRGEKIKIRISGRWERCEFAGATDEFLYCAPPEDSGSDQAAQIDRLNITDFKPDHDVRNGRLIFTAVTLGSGLALAIRGYQSPGVYTPTPSAVFGGLLGTGIGAVAGAGFSCLSGHCVKLPSLNPGPPANGFNVNLPMRGIPPHRRR